MNDRKPLTERRILEVLRASRRGPMRVKHLARDLGLAESDKGLKPLLEEMVRRGAVYRVKGGRYAAPDRISLVTGRVSTIRSGDAFLRPDEADQQDVFIPGSDLDTAMDGDKAVVRIERRPKGRNPVGRVINRADRPGSGGPLLDVELHADLARLNFVRVVLYKPLSEVDQ